MSYILDALRRADAERERGAVPGIHAQQVPTPPSDPQGGPRSWAWLAGGAALLLLAAIAWLWMGSDDEPPPAPVAAMPPPLPQVASAPRPSPAISLPPIVVTEAPRPRPAPPASAPAVQARIPTLQELPEDIRRQVPQMSVGGSIYSPNAASRFLIINGQVFHEGHKITPDLVLEEIKLKAAVMSFKGRRFTMTF
jgi:general secretion pathway protein B